MTTPDIALAGAALPTLAADPALATPLDVPAVEQIDTNVIEWEVLESPRDTKGWTMARRDGIETFTAPDGKTFVRARPDEEADVQINFTRIPGMTSMRLIEASESATVRLIIVCN